ncbi:MAG: hypothetical protein V3T77_02175 [Planctomycetota bacterium]
MQGAAGESRAELILEEILPQEPGLEAPGRPLFEPAEIPIAKTSGQIVKIVRKNSSSTPPVTTEPKPEMTPQPALTATDAALEELRRELLARLHEYEGAAERSLDDAQRLTKHKLQRELIALHFLKPGEQLDYLDPLLRSLEDPAYPGVALTYLSAALFQDVGREDRIQGVLKRVERNSPIRRFGIDSFTILRDPPRGYGQYTPQPLHTFRPDETLILYMELLNLTNEKIGNEWRRWVKVDAYLYHRETRKKLDRRSLTGNEGIVQRDFQRNEHNFFWHQYRLPLGLETGSYKLAIEASDMITGETASADLAIEIMR